MPEAEAVLHLGRYIQDQEREIGGEGLELRTTPHRIAELPLHRGAYKEGDPSVRPRPDSSP